MEEKQGPNDVVEETIKDKKEKNNPIKKFILKHKKLFTILAIEIGVLLLAICGYVVFSQINNNTATETENNHVEKETSVLEQSKITFEELCEKHDEFSVTICGKILKIKDVEFVISYFSDSKYPLNIDGIYLQEDRFLPNNFITLEIFKDTAIVVWVNNGRPRISIYSINDGRELYSINSAHTVDEEYPEMQLTNSSDEEDEWRNRTINVYGTVLYSIVGNEIEYKGSRTHFGECNKNNENEIVSATYVLEYLGDSEFASPVRILSKTMAETGSCGNFSDDIVTTKEQAKNVAQRVYEMSYDVIEEGAGLTIWSGDYKRINHNNEELLCREMYFTKIGSFFTENAINYIKNNLTDRFAGDDNYYTCMSAKDFQANYGFLLTIFGATDSGIRPLTITSYTSDSIIATGQIVCDTWEGCWPDEEPLNITFKKVNGIWKIDTFD